MERDLRVISALVVENLDAHLQAVSQFTRRAVGADHARLAELRCEAHELLDAYLDSQIRAMDLVREQQGVEPRR